MFIATDATGSAKLQRSGMASRRRPHHWRAVGRKMAFMPLLKELGRASRVGVTIDMALLTELGTYPSLKVRIRCSSK